MPPWLTSLLELRRDFDSRRNDPLKLLAVRAWVTSGEYAVMTSTETEVGAIARKECVRLQTRPEWRSDWMEGRRVLADDLYTRDQTDEEFAEAGGKVRSVLICRDVLYADEGATVDEKPTFDFKEWCATAGQWLATSPISGVGDVGKYGGQLWINHVLAVATAGHKDSALRAEWFYSGHVAMIPSESPRPRYGTLNMNVFRASVATMDLARTLYEPHGDSLDPGRKPAVAQHGFGLDEFTRELIANQRSEAEIRARVKRELGIGDGPNDMAVFLARAFTITYMDARGLGGGDELYLLERLTEWKSPMSEHEAQAFLARVRSDYARVKAGQTVLELEKIGRDDSPEEKERKARENDEKVEYNRCNTLFLKALPKGGEWVPYEMTQGGVGLAPVTIGAKPELADHGPRVPHVLSQAEAVTELLKAGQQLAAALVGYMADLESAPAEDVKRDVNRDTGMTNEALGKACRRINKRLETLVFPYRYKQVRGVVWKKEGGDFGGHGGGQS